MSDDRDDWFAPEPLHPDLVPYITEATHFVGSKILHHPYVIQLPWHEALAKMTNRQYLYKKERVQEAVKEGNWSSFIYLHERPYRFEALIQAMNYGAGEDEKWWELVASVWIDSENIHQHLDDWKSLWSGIVDEDQDERPKAMEEGEWKAFEALPDHFQIWRGITHKDAAKGMSWTVDRERAIWFGRRFAEMEGRAPYLVSGTVRKADVLAHFTRRNESEIVVLPEDVQNIKVRKIPARKSK